MPGHTNFDSCTQLYTSQQVMEALYHSTNRLIQETQECFQKLEKLPGDQDSIEKEIQEKINEVNSNCEKLDVYLYKVPLAQRPNYKMRCDQLKYDNRHLQAALKAWQLKKARKLAEISEREQLLNRRFAPNPENTAINMDYSIQHHNSLQNANRGVDDMIGTGTSILESLRDQRSTLKGAHRRIIDMANTLGLSNATMRLIERRISEDKYILIGGMLVTILVIILVIVYVA